MRCRTFHFPVVIEFFPDRWMDGWIDRFGGYQQIGGKKSFFFFFGGVVVDRWLNAN